MAQVCSDCIEHRWCRTPSTFNAITAEICLTSPDTQSGSQRATIGETVWGVIALQSLLQFTCIVLGFFILNLNSGERLAAQGPVVAVRPPRSQRRNLEVRAYPRASLSLQYH